jgi:hypothetical protein
VKHFLIFIGPSPALSTELLSLQKSFVDVRVIALAARKEHIGLCETSVERASSAFIEALTPLDDQKSAARLSVWCFLPQSADRIELLWRAFGRSAWIEFIPINLIHKDRPTRMYIQERLEEVIGCLHQIYLQVYGHRKTSPVPLPFENFRSSMISEFQKYWYRGLTDDALKKHLANVAVRFRQMHATRSRRHRDDRRLLFSPAKDGECHGQPHPTGTGKYSFINGRFRFGSALFPGFHYDVSSETETAMECVLIDAEGQRREMKAEKRMYINIFPNNYLSPPKTP